jgi:hypothetical protein
MAMARMEDRVIRAFRPLIPVDDERFNRLLSASSRIRLTTALLRQPLHIGPFDAPAFHVVGMQSLVLSLVFVGAITRRGPGPTTPPCCAASSSRCWCRLLRCWRDWCSIS